MARRSLSGGNGGAWLCVTPNLIQGQRKAARPLSVRVSVHRGEGGLSGAVLFVAALCFRCMGNRRPAGLGKIRGGRLLVHPREPMGAVCSASVWSSDERIGNLGRQVPVCPAGKPFSLDIVHGFGRSGLPFVGRMSQVTARTGSGAGFRLAGGGTATCRRVSR